MNIPQTLRAGDLWNWVDSLSDYPSPTYVLTYHLRGPKPLTLTAAQYGSTSDHETNVVAATTAAYVAGAYEWLARVTLSGTVVDTVGSGRLALLADLANQAGEYRTFNVRVRDALQAVIENRASTDQLSLSIAGRSISRMSWDEILAAYGHFQKLAAAELGESQGRIFVRFARP